MPVDKFTHLHVHDEYSTLDGFGTPEAFASRCSELGQEYLAITNHGNVDSAIKFQKACLKNNVKPIFGCELYIDKNRHLRGKDAERRHLTVWVKNKRGWRNLLKMLTIANLEGFVRKPRIDVDTLLANCKGLCVGTACLGSFINEEWGVKLLKQLTKTIPGDVYVEIMPHNFDKQKSFNLKAVELAKKLNLKTITTNDCHYPLPENAKTQELQLAIASSSDWNDPKRYKFDVQSLYLCSSKEIKQWYKKNHPYLDKGLVRSSISNTLEVAEKCSSFRIEQAEVHLPLIDGVEQGKEQDFLHKLVYDGLKAKIKSKHIPRKLKQKYLDRIAEELGLLFDKGFERYFLIVWELVNWCRNNDIMVGPGRGSVGGSLVAYLMDITAVDPITYDLVFSRFVSPERSDLPDIDLDFQRDKRALVIQHISDSYGKNNVSQISTFLKMKDKMALQDVARTFGVHRDEVVKVTKLIDDNDVVDVDFFSNSEHREIKVFARKNPKIIEMACDIKGTIRGYGKHAAGVCISNVDLTKGKNCNLVKRSGSIVANWDKDDGEFMGLMKLDVLGLVTLDEIQYCLELIKKNHGEDVDLNSLTLDDAGVFDDLSKGRTEGVFQLGSYGLTRFCMDLGIDSFKDVYNATALFRPGTLRSGMAAEFVKRKHGKKYKAIHENVEELTKDTYGIILYQEQAMRMAKDLAGFSWAKCNLLRKVIAKSQGKDEFNKFKGSFVNGCVENETLNKKQAEELFDTIAEFSKYSFNLSHSVEYSYISYWTAWLKHYYPAEFFASCLSFESKDKKKDLLDAAIDEGLFLSPPKTGKSEACRWVVDGDTLVMPFTEINGIGDAMAEKIVKESTKKRQGFFSSSATLNLSAKEKTILKNIKAGSNKELSINDLNAMKDYFSFNIVRLIKRTM